MGYSENDRILQLSSRGISYFSKIPKELETGTIMGGDIRELKLKPKLSVSIACIIQCEEISKEERTKFKKFFKEDTQVFKLVFD